MYDLPYFKADNENEVFNFMQANPFITLVGCDAGNKPAATHVPVLIEKVGEKLHLHGHIMCQTSHHKAFEVNPYVLVIFTGPHTYVSASWYSEPKQASTWNYLAVHAKGQLQFKDEAFLLNVLKKTTTKFEKENSLSSFENLPPEYVERLSKAIIAFEIEVTSVEHVFKLSQNRDKESYNNIIQHLSGGDEDAKQVAAIMKEREHK